MSLTNWVLADIQAEITTSATSDNILAEAKTLTQLAIANAIADIDALFIANGDIDHRPDPVNSPLLLGTLQAQMIGKFATGVATGWTDAVWLAIGNSELDKVNNFPTLTDAQGFDTINFGDALDNPSVDLLEAVQVAPLIDSETTGLITRYLRDIRSGIDQILRQYFETSGMIDSITFSDEQVVLLEILANNDPAGEWPWIYVVKNIDKLNTQYNNLVKQMTAVTPDYV